MLFSRWTSIPIQTTIRLARWLMYEYEMGSLQISRKAADNVNYVVMIHDVKIWMTM